MNRVPTMRGRAFTIGSASTFDGRARRCGRRGSVWVAVGALALGTMLGLGASPAAALPSMPAAAFGGSSGASPLNGAIFAGDLDAAEPRLGSDHPLVQQVLAERDLARRQLKRSGEKKG